MFNFDNAFKAYQETKALGEASINSEFIMVIDGYEYMQYMLKEFPIPVVNPEDVIEVPMVGGTKTKTPQMANFSFSGGISFIERVEGHVRNLIETIQANRSVRNRPKFNATIYHGTIDDHAQKWRIKDAVLHGFDPITVDYENRGALTTYSGQISFMYFPDVE